MEGPVSHKLIKICRRKGLSATRDGRNQPQTDRHTYMWTCPFIYTDVHSRVLLLNKFSPGSTSLALQRSIFSQIATGIANLTKLLGVCSMFVLGTSDNPNQCNTMGGVHDYTMVTESSSNFGHPTAVDKADTLHKFQGVI